MAKKYFLDKRSTVSGKPNEQGYDDFLDVNDHIEKVVDQAEFTSLVSATVTTTTAVVTNTVSERTSAAGVTVDGVKLKDGGVTNPAGTQIAGFYPLVAQNDIAAGTGGAILVTNYLTTINTDAGGDAFTLANGTQIGQLKKILLVVDGGGNGVVTPATAFAGGTTATFGDAGDYVILLWSGTAWVVIENSGVTIA